MTQVPVPIVPTPPVTLPTLSRTPRQQLDEDYLAKAQRRLVDMPDFGGIEIPHLKDDWTQRLLAPRLLDIRNIAFADRSDVGSPITESNVQQAVGQIRQGIVSKGLSLLSAAASIVDKPFAAFRGLMAGDVSQLSLLLPFSESYLRKFYEEKLGIPIPSHHITGREVLERWGFQENIPGFHPIEEPLDAVLDAAGLAIELFGPAYVPRIGALTRIGEQAFQLGKLSSLKPVTNLLDNIGDLLEKGAPLAKRLNVPKTPSTNIVEELLEQIAGQPAADAAKEIMRAIPTKQALKVADVFHRAAQRGDSKALGAAIKFLSSQSRLMKNLQAGKGILPAVSIPGQMQEIASGVRGLIIEPVGILRQVAPRIELPLPGSGLVQSVSELAPMRALRALFDWTVRGAYDKAAQSAAAFATESARHTLAALTNHMHDSQAMLAAMADELASLGVQMRMAGNRLAPLNVNELVQYIAQRGKDAKRTIDDILKSAVSTQPGAKALDQLAEKVYLTSDTMIRAPIDKLREQLIELGYPNFRTRDPAYLPTYSPMTGDEFGRTGYQALISEAARRKTAKRLAPLQFAPFGRVPVNRASRDAILTRQLPSSYAMIAAEKNGTNAMLVIPDELADEIPPLSGFNLQAVKTKTGDSIIFGDYVAIGNSTEPVARYIGHRPGPNPTAILWTRANKPVEVPLTDIRPTAPPKFSGDEFLVPGLPSGSNGMVLRRALAQDALKSYGIDVPIKGRKGSTRRLLQEYLFRRYFEPEAGQYERLVELARNKSIDAEAAKALAFFFRPKDLKPEQYRAILKAAKFPRNMVRLFKQNGTSYLLLDYLMKHSGRPVYSNDVLSNLWQHFVGQSQYLAALSGVHEGLAHVAKVIDDPRLMPEGLITLAEAWDKIRVPIAGHGAMPLTPRGLETFVNRLRAMNPEIDKALGGLPSARAAELIAVPAKSADALSRFVKVFVPGTDERLAYENILSKYMGWLSSWTYLPRISSRVRDLTSNFLMSILHPDVPYTPKEYASTFLELSERFLKGTLHEAEYYDEMRKLGVLSTGHRVSDVSLERPATLLGSPDLPALFGEESIAAALPKALSAKETVSPIARAVSKPFGWDGLLSFVSPKVSGKAVNPLIETGRNLFAATEQVSRGAIYTAARKAGMQPAQAAELAKTVLYDYSRMSPFERRALRPTIMFYGWLRSNLSYNIPKVMLDWNSWPSKIVRSIGRIKAQSTHEMPEWLENSLAFPIADENGQVTVVRSLGLPPEDLAMISPDVSEFLAKSISWTHPVLRGIYVLASGREPYTGMSIRDYRSLTEKLTGITGLPPVVSHPLRAFETAIAPPLSFLGYLGKLASGQEPMWAKAIDAISGVKVGTYDLEKVLTWDTMRRLRDELLTMDKVGLIERPWIREGASPRAQELYDALRTVEKISREQREREKKQQAVKAQPVTIEDLFFPVGRPGF